MEKVQWNSINKKQHGQTNEKLKIIQPPPTTERVKYESQQSAGVTRTEHNLEL